MSDLAKEIANTVVRIKTEMRKASFASRSEAGRYAANQRWKGQGKQAKTADDDGLSIRGMTPAKMAADELRTYIDEQEGLLEAMQGSASKAELKQQKGLITLARRDLRRMEEGETAGGELPSASQDKSPARGVDRGRDVVDNDVNDNGDSIDDLNSRYQNDNEYIPFEDLPNGGFREEVIAAFIDAKAASYYDEPGRLKGPYDRPSNKMTDKGYAKARAHALKGNMDNSPSDLDEYWDDNSSVFWDEYAMITDQYSTNE